MNDKDHNGDLLSRQTDEMCGLRACAGSMCLAVGAAKRPPSASCRWASKLAAALGHAWLPYAPLALDAALSYL